MGVVWHHLGEEKKKLHAVILGMKLHLRFRYKVVNFSLCIDSEILFMWSIYLEIVNAVSDIDTRKSIDK